MPEHNVRRAGNLIRVILSSPGSAAEALEAGKTALGKGERLEQTYTIDGHTFGYVARRA